MTTRIQREFSFQAGTYCDVFLMNTYSFSLCMDVETDSMREQNIAMDRIKYFLAECLESSIFISNAEKKMLDKYTACGFKVCVLPEEPYDQIITIMLLLKLNAITEGRLVITDITLESRLGDEVNFLYDIDSPIGPFSAPGWWSDAGCGITDKTKILKKEKIVNLFTSQAATWNDFGLGWKEKDITLVTKTEIAFSTETDK